VIFEPVRPEKVRVEVESGVPAGKPAVQGGHLGPLEIDLRGRLGKYFVLGGGAASGIVGIYMILNLFRENPRLFFDLLQQWGPRFALLSMAMYFAWDLLRPLVGYVGSLADGMQSLSKAVATIAEKDDRQMEEMRRMAQFAGQQSERLFELLVQQAEQTKTVLEKVENIDRAISGRAGLGLPQ
jgi:hypothetical protein